MMVNTVTGRIPAENLGRTLIHEHIICSSAEMMMTFHPAWNPPERVVPRAAAMLKKVKEDYGITTVVDGTPLTLGRNLDLLKAVSEEAEVNIIASTGFYVYNTFTARVIEPHLLAELMIDEIENGAIAPGFLKCAVEDAVTPCIRNYIAAVSHVQRATSLPVFVHSSAARRSGGLVLDELAKFDVPFDKVVVGHTADALDIEYPLSLLERGVNVSLDRIYGDGRAKGELAGQLIKMGHADRIFLSHDAICFEEKANLPEYEAYNDFNVERLAVLHKFVVPALTAAGIPEEVFQQKIFTDNVRRLFI